MQYPKMLYKGDQENYQTIIADNEDHEAELLADDWIQYGDLPNPSVEDQYAETVDKSSDPIGFVPTEQFDALASKLAETEDQLATSQGEFIAFQNNVAAMKARIAELQGDTTPAGSTSHSGAHLISLNDLTLAQLQEMAKSKGIEFKVRDSKGTLIELLMDYQDKELANANQTA